MESVMLVNGPPAGRKAHREVLERAGYVVKEVIALDAALRVAREEPPLAVILECADRPDLQQRFITSLRGHPSTGDIPVLMVVADDLDERPLVELPALSAISDRSTPRELLEELAYITRGRDVQRAEGMRALPPEPHGPPFPSDPRLDPPMSSGPLSVYRDTRVPIPPHPRFQRE
jgi:CheY-like chemotaxis protein